MIIGQIELKKDLSPKLSQKIDCKCESCDKIFKRIYSAAIKEARFCKSCATINMNRTRDPAIHAKMISNAAKTWKGKTRIEICGFEKALAASKSQSIKNAGKNNPNYGGKYSKGFKDNPLTGTFEKRYGVDKANEMKNKLSIANSGTNNPMYGKPSPAGSGNGISGWYNDELYFRSLLELAFILKCKKENKPIYSAEKKEYRFEYEINGRARTYVPDFVDENGTLYELKPENLLNSYQVKLKIKAAPSVIMITEKDVTRPTVEQLKQLINIGLVKIDPSKMGRVK